MSTALQSKALRVILCALVLLVASLYIVETVRLYAATRLSDQPDRASLEKAIRYAPLNAEYRSRLAGYYLYVDQNAERAAQNYAEAARLTPTSARPWLGFAQAKLISGDTRGAIEAVDRAVAVNPREGAILWEAGNLYLVLGETKKGLRLFRTVGDYDPALPERILETAWRATRDVDAVVDNALPPEVRWRQSLLVYVLSRRDLDSATRAWQRLNDLHRPIDKEPAFLYEDALLEAHRGADAYQSWTDYLSLTGHKVSETGNAVFNGSFEDAPLNGGFDWRIGAAQGVSVSLDVSEKHSGAHSLFIEMRSNELQRFPIVQWIRLSPNSRYRFSAWVRSRMVTASGVRFAIADSSGGTGYLAKTEEILEPGDWKQVTAQFQTGSNTNTAQVMLLRDMGETFIQGDLWIDDVSVTKEPK